MLLSRAKYLDTWVKPIAVGLDEPVYVWKLPVAELLLCLVGAIPSDFLRWSSRLCLVKLSLMSCTFISFWRELPTMAFMLAVRREHLNKVGDKYSKAVILLLLRFGEMELKSQKLMIFSFWVWQRTNSFKVSQAKPRGIVIRVLL